MRKYVIERHAPKLAVFAVVGSPSTLPRDFNKTNRGELRIEAFIVFRNIHNQSIQLPKFHGQ